VYFFPKIAPIVSPFARFVSGDRQAESEGVLNRCSFLPDVSAEKAPKKTLSSLFFRF
jgi:hypothetical protein